MKYDKIIKWILVALFIVGAILSFYGFAVGFESNGSAPVDNILYCAYAFVGITLLAVVLGVVVIGGINNPNSLLKLGLGIIAIAAIIAVAYVLAPGSPAVGYLGEPVSDQTLKLTDTILNLTYLLCGATLASLIIAWVVSAIRK